MVARVVTINAPRDRVAQVLDYYAGLAADQLDRSGPSQGPVDYYLDPNEPPGRWWGTGCPALGLARGGPVLLEQLWALLEARHPADGRRLGRGFGDRSARGFDARSSSGAILCVSTPSRSTPGSTPSASRAVTGQLILTRAG